MENRKSHHQVNIDKKADQNIQPLKNIDPMPFILEKYDSFFAELSVEKEGFQILKKEIIDKISSWVTGLYHATPRNKIIKNLEGIENIFSNMSDHFKQLDQTRQLQLPIESNSIIFLNVLCTQHLPIIVDTLKDIEELIKKHYQDQALVTKIENFKFIFEFKQKNLTKFHEIVKLYIDNKKIIEDKSNLLKKSEAKNKTLRGLIEENKKEIQEKQSNLHQIEESFNTFSKTIQLLKDCVDTCINQDAILLNLKNEIFLSEQSLYLTTQFFNNITDILEKGKSFLIDIEKGYEASLAKISLSFDHFKEYNLCLSDIEKNAEKMKEIITVIQLMSIDNKSNSLVDLSKNNLISINQCNLLIQNLTEKTIEFNNELNLLEKQFKSIKDVYADDQVISSKKIHASAFIDSPEYIDTASYDDNEEKKELLPISIIHANKLLEYIKKVIITHEWEVRGIGYKGSLLDRQKTTTICTTFITTHYAGKMIEVLNASTLCQEDAIKGCVAAVDKVKNITRDALLAVSLFRANSTQVAYRNLDEDIDNFKKLLQSNKINEISDQIDVLMDEHTTTYGLVKFETKCQKIKDKKKLTLIDKLIQFYFIAKEFLYYKDLSVAEREYLYCIVLILKQTDAATSLDNIKNEIITRSTNNTWTIPVGGGSTITINKNKYKVPYHVRRIWKIFEGISEHELHELVVFSNRYNFSPYLTLSKIMQIAHHAVLHVPFSRDKDSQSFYLDILTGKYDISLEKERLLICQN